MSEVVDHGFIHSIYAFDPNGIPIEFSHNVPEVDIRKNPAMVDHDPSAVTMEGPEPQPGHWPRAPQTTPLKERKVYPGAGKDLIDPNRQKW